MSNNFRSRKKISANVDPFYIKEGEKLRKKLGISTFSRFIEILIRDAINDPLKLMGNEVQRAAQNLAMWQNMYRSLEEVKNEEAGKIVK